jgi:DNA-binding beta-propeller fold protein YncE
MRSPLRSLGALALLVASVSAAQAPWGKGADLPPAAGDRVFLADQASNSISVIDPFAGKLLGVIRLGQPLPASLRPVYRGQFLVHGLGYSPDSKTLAAVCVGSNSVVFIDIPSNAIKKTVYLGRSPHEAMWTPDGAEVWVAIRGQDYIQVGPFEAIEASPGGGWLSARL